MKSLIIVLIPALLLSCNAKKAPNISALTIKPAGHEKAGIPVIPAVDTTSEYTFDSTLVLFGDTAYKINYHVFELLNDDRPNTALTFTKSAGGKTDIVFRDSLSCLHPEIESGDFNNDKTKDLLFFHYTGARANPSYYLYLVDNKHRRLQRVYGFEELPNPWLDTIHNIITSLSLSGMNHYSFYTITAKGKLVDLGHPLEDDGTDTAQYERALKLILKERKHHRAN